MGFATANKIIISGIAALLIIMAMLVLAPDAIEE
jgi:hypothetical protein